MDFFLFVLLSAIYIMIIHYAIAIKKEFNLMLMIGLFIFSGFIGFLLHSYEVGFVLGIILTLVFW